MSNFETIINSIRNILRNEGVTGMDSINHCVAFVIMKYLTIQKCENFNIPVKYAYENFLNDDNNQPFSNNDHRILTKFYSVDAEDDDLLSHLRDKFNFNQFRFKITSPFNFFTIFKKISELNLDDISEEYDIVGMIYEIHLKTGTSNSLRDLGQFFTHRKVIKYMVELCEPKLKSNGEIETILDPSLGTGGFLTMSIKYLNKKYQNINWNLNKSNIYGFDIDDNVRNLALLNTLLESGQILNNNIVKNDTLQNDYTLDYKTVINSVDIILANEPFGLKSLKYKDCCKRIKELKIDGTKSEPLFLQLMMRSLNKNGRCAVIVPEGVLFNDASLHIGTRKYLIENLNLKKIISLGDKLFLNTGVKSSILYFVNDGKTKEVEYLNIKLSNGTLIEESIIKVKVDDIVKNKYYLGINKYLKTEEIKHEGLEYKKLGEICKFMQNSKRNASFGKDSGKYPFYTSSNILSKYCDEADYNEECIIIGTGGLPNIKINNNFSCSSHHLVIKSEYNKYIYYWFLSNMQKLGDLFHGSTIKNLSKTDLENIEIPIPSLEIQNKIVNILDIIYNKIELNKQSINSYEQLRKNIIHPYILSSNKNKLINICDIKSGKPINKENRTGTEYPYFAANGIDGYVDNYLFDGEYIICAQDGSIGATHIYNGKFYASNHVWLLQSKNNISNKFLY